MDDNRQDSFDWECRCCGVDLALDRDEVILVVDQPFCLPCYQLIIVGKDDYSLPTV